MNVGQLAGGIALGAGVGVASGIAMRNVAYEHANVSPDVVRERAVADPEGYLREGPYILGAFGAIVLGVGGVHMFAEGLPAVAGVGMLAGAGLFAGGFVGGIIGASQGGKAARDTFGTPDRTA